MSRTLKTPTDSVLLHARAPARIDFAGGTVDLWPLFLLLDRPLTVNLGIDLFAEATLEWKPAMQEGPEVELRTADLSHRLDLKWSELESAKFPPQVELHGKLLRHFAQTRITRGDRTFQQGQIRLSTQAKSPAGAGLGGSSTLSVALIGALASWASGDTELPPNREKLIAIARDIETTVIQVPAGVQDYYGAMYGGLQALHWGVAENHRESLIPEGNETRDFRAIEDRTLLFYSGQSRNSGINNWSLYQKLINRDSDVQERFRAITEASRALREAWLAHDYALASAAIEAEWDARRGLATGITTAEIDEAFRRASRLGVTAGKICGAGGGGCFFVYAKNADSVQLDRVREEICQIPGIRHLPFKASPHGLEVKTSRA